MVESIPSNTQDPASLLRDLTFDRILNQDTRTKTITYLCTLSSSTAILIAEKTAFSSDSSTLLTHPLSPPSILHHGSNDIYHWFLASHSAGLSPEKDPRGADLKLTLIHPATETHIRKYSAQRWRAVVETPEVYDKYVKKYVEEKRGSGRLNWVYNILDGKAERDRVICEDKDEEWGWVVLPDSKWDRTTLSALYTLCLVHRRDISSLRDLRKKHVPWLRRLQSSISAGICAAYPGLEEDQLRLYVHYHPTYYHLHIHAVSLEHDAGAGQYAGKALLLGNVISQLETMAGDDEAGLQNVDLTFTVGEESELWKKIFGKLKNGEEPTV